MIGELLLSSVILSTSFSVRTPNDDTKPLDYEYMIKAEETEGNFTWSVKRDWERELGEKYEDNVWKINQKSRILYGGIDYVNKESKDIKYTLYNVGLHHKSGLKVGLSMKEDELLLSAGFKLKDLITESSMVNFGVAKEDKSDFEEVLKDFGIKAKILNARNMPKRIVYSVPFAKVMKLISVLDRKKIWWMVATKGGMN